jgi:hypothetical protein
VSLYLAAIKENTTRITLNIKSNRKTDTKHEVYRSCQDNNIQRLQREPPEENKTEFAQRANITLDTMRKRIWQDDKWPLVTEVGVKRAGRWILNPNVYHNHTVWPWIMGIEMLARSRFERIQECSNMLSVITSEGYQNGNLAFYEWVDPLNRQGMGAYPFRTGISAIRTALLEIIKRTANKESQK